MSTSTTTEGILQNWLQVNLNIKADETRKKLHSSLKLRFSVSFCKTDSFSLKDRWLKPCRQVQLQGILQNWQLDFNRKAEWDKKNTAFFVKVKGFLWVFAKQIHFHWKTDDLNHVDRHNFREFHKIDNLSI